MALDHAELCLKNQWTEMTKCSCTSINKLHCNCQQKKSKSYERKNFNRWHQACIALATAQFTLVAVACNLHLMVSDIFHVKVGGGSFADDDKYIVKASSFVI